MKTSSIDFDGLSALEITTSRLRMVVVTSLGPRVAYLGRPGGDNLLHWRVDNGGRKGWRLLGGHRVWATRPMADESEDAYAADNEPCQVSMLEGAATVTGAQHPFLRTRRGLTIREVDSDTLEVTSFVTNDGPMLYSGSAWGLTCIQPRSGMTFGIPLGDRSLAWDIIKMVMPRTWADHTAPVNDPQIRFNEEFMIVEPQGVETKRMLWAPRGLIAMTWPEKRLSFVKRTSSIPGGRYPLDCNLAIYVGPGNFMADMESFSEEKNLQPGQTVANVERWKLADETLEWKDADRLLTLMR
jgi:hypothetical protein